MTKLAGEHVASEWRSGVVNDSGLAYKARAVHVQG